MKPQGRVGSKTSLLCPCSPPIDLPDATQAVAQPAPQSERPWLMAYQDQTSARDLGRSVSPSEGTMLIGDPKI
jgi:hypothetical protein